MRDVCNRARKRSTFERVSERCTERIEKLCPAFRLGLVVVVVTVGVVAVVVCLPHTNMKH